MCPDARTHKEHNRFLHLFLSYFYDSNCNPAGPRARLVSNSGYLHGTGFTYPVPNTKYLARHRILTTQLRVVPMQIHYLPTVIYVPSIRVEHTRLSSKVPIIKYISEPSSTCRYRTNLKHKSVVS
eukprot:SAG11_NODE_11784_length_738_cov_1.358372_1_plen_125_part_00